jgi:uncharacterized protein YciI
MHRLIAIVLALLLSSLSVAGQQDTLFLVFLNTNPEREKLPVEQVEELQKGHLENISRLAKEDVIQVAGPFDGGGGIFIIKANSLEEVDQILATDPAVSANRFKLEIFPWYQTKGSVCPVGEEYEMTTYGFIRIVDGAKADFAGTGEIVDVLSSQQGIRIIAATNFDEEGRGIVIYEGDLSTVPQGLSDDNPAYQVKKLWVARGSFCEE